MASFYQARQRQRDGRWDMTVSSDDEGWCHAIGYCAGPFRPLEPSVALRQEQCDEYNRKHAPFSDRYHADGHESSQEAEACYREYRLDHELRFWPDREDAREQHRCEAPGCGAWTSGRGEMKPFDLWHLCAEHQTREAVKALLDARRAAHQEGT